MNETQVPPSPAPLIPRQQALEEFKAILRPEAERVLNVHGGGGQGKTWFLKDIQRYCQEHGLLYNRQIIDFYDTAHHRVSGLIASIIQELDPEHEFFGPYLELRAEFDRLRAQGFGGRALEEIGKRMDCAFLTGLQALGAARRRPDGSKGVVLLLDTFEVVQEGRVGRWVLEDLLGSSENLCTEEENPPPIVAAQDIAVVIAGRPPLDPAKTPASIIRFCSPGNFSPHEIEHYLKQVLGRYQDVSLATEPVGQLASWIAEKTGGHPVLVALALDLANLYIATHHGTPELTGGGLLGVLQETDGQEMALIERIMDLLGNTPEQQWAVLFMAHLRRRFTRQLCATLMNKPPHDVGLEAAFTAFEHLYMAKYRHLRGTFRLPPDEARQFEETTVSLHDLIRDWVYDRYWRGSIPLSFVRQGRQAGIFPSDLDELWEKACDWEGEQAEIPAARLQPILRWLDDRAVAFYEARRRELDSQRARVDKEQEPSRWVEYEYQQHALMAEQLLYEMDRDLEKGWRRWRRAYYEAFEAYQQGYCEQLELTVLSAWSNGELEADPRKREIQEMARVRQLWWKIQYSDRAREQAIQELEQRVREQELPLGGEPSELLADTCSALGWAYALEGETRLARQHRSRAADILRRLRLDWDLAMVLDFLGESCDQLGLFRRAGEAWEEAIQIARRLGDHYRLASVAMKWGYSLNLQGESSRALGYAKVAETLFRELGDDRSRGLALNHLSRIYQALGKFAHAQRALDESQLYCDRFGSPDDRVRLAISWGEFYRRRAQSEQAQADDFAQAQEALENALRLAQEEGFGRWETQAVEELGCLFRDRARIAAQKARRREAGQLWKQAREKLTWALDRYREQDAGFKMADLLDDLCQLYADQYRFQKKSRGALEEHLDELEEIARDRECPLHLARVAERRAGLAWEDGRWEEAVEQYVQACSYVGLHTRAGETFRTSYDRLVGQLEGRLKERPDDKEQVRLAQLALQRWGQTGHAASHPQFARACRRVLYPAQARLDEARADELFEQGRREHEAGQVDQACQHFQKAFEQYVQACDRMGRLTDGAFENYERYMELVAKLERRFYDLPDLRLALRYSEQVQIAWQRLEQAERHPAVLEVCRRAWEMAELVQRLTEVHS